MGEKIATREAYGKALVELGEKNNKVVVLDADLSKSTKTADFKTAFPDRFFNVGVAEQNLIGTSAGLATTGKVVFASSFAMFATGRAYEQIRNSVGYPKLNVKIAATHAGLTVGEDGASHQAIEDIALMRVVPNMTVLVPSDAEETRQAIMAAAEIDGPVYIRLGRPAVPVLHDEKYTFQVGKGEILREGDDVTVVATGIMVGKALEAAEILAKEDIQITVLNMATIKPLDHDILRKYAEKTGALVTAEEHSIIGGLNGAVAESLVANKPVPVESVGVLDTFGESGKPDQLLEKYHLTAQDIVSSVKKVIKRK